jgi:hypothetical protein
VDTVESALLAVGYDGVAPGCQCHIAQRAVGWTFQAMKKLASFQIVDKCSGAPPIRRGSLDEAVKTDFGCPEQVPLGITSHARP